MATASSSPSGTSLANVWTRRVSIRSTSGRSSMTPTTQHIAKTARDRLHSIISISTVSWRYSCKASRRMHAWITSHCHLSTWATWNKTSCSRTEKAKLNSIRILCPSTLMVSDSCGSNIATKIHASCTCIALKGPSRYSYILSLRMMAWSHMSSLSRRRTEAARRSSMWRTRVR